MKYCKKCLTTDLRPNAKEIIGDKRYYKEKSLFPKELSKHFAVLKKGFSKKQI